MGNNLTEYVDIENGIFQKIIVTIQE